LATTITVRAETNQASREIKQLSKDVGTVGDAARDASSKSADALDKVARELSDVQREAKEAGQAVGQIDDYADFGDLQKQANAAQAAIKGVTEASKNAAPAVAGVGDASKRTGEGAKLATDAIGQMLTALASGQGLSGVALGAKEKLAALSGFIAGPWGAAVTIGVSVLGSLVAKMLESSDASDEAAKATDRHREAMQKYIDLIERRTEQERELRDIGEMNAEQAHKTAEDLAKQHDDNRRNLNQVVEAARGQQDALKRINEEIKSIMVESRGNVSLEESARLKQLGLEMTSIESGLNTLRTKRLELIDRETQLEEKLQKARSTAETKRIEETATAEEEERRKRQEAESKAAEEQRQRDEETIRKKQEAEERVAEQTRKRQEEIARKEAEKAAQDLAERQAAQIKAMASDKESASNQIISSITPQDIAEQVAQRRVSELNIEGQIQELEGSGATKPEVYARRQQLNQEARQVRRQAFHDTASGSLSDDELRTAQQDSANAITDELAKSKALSSDVVSTVKESVRLSLSNQSELDEMRQEIANMRKALQQSQQQGTRRRAQMGGAR